MMTPNETEVPALFARYAFGDLCPFCHGKDVDGAPAPDATILPYGGDDDINATDPHYLCTACCGTWRADEF